MHAPITTEKNIFDGENMHAHVLVHEVTLSELNFQNQVNKLKMTATEEEVTFT